MTNNKTCLVLITLNEVAGVSVLLPELLKLQNIGFDEILAVDGGSTDGTLELFEKFNLRTIKQQTRGRGSAIRLAAEATRSDFEFLIFFSPDGNEDAQDIHKFNKYFQQGYDLVIGSRMMPGGTNEEDHKIFRWRKWANKFFNLAAHLFRKEKIFIFDSINGFRGIKRQLIEDLALDAAGFTIEYQMTIRSFILKKRIVEFPTVESKRIAGKTKAPSISTGFAFIYCFYQELIRAVFKSP